MMSRNLRGVVALLACLAMIGASAEAGVKVRFFKGQPTFVSVQHSSVVEVAAPLGGRSQVPIGIMALNGGASPVSLGYENVSVRTRAGQSLKLVTYEDLQHQARVRAGWATFFAVLAAGANGYVAERSSYGYVGGYRFRDPVAAQIGLDRATAQNAAMMGSIEQALAAKMAQLDGQVLRTTTIDPYSAEGGAVYVALPHGVAVSDLVVTVEFAGDVHEITLSDASSMQQASEADVTLAGPPGAPAAPSPMMPSDPTAAPPPPRAAPIASAPASHHCPGLSSPTDPDAVTCISR
jgi:hypothetical protein